MNEANQPKNVCEGANVVIKNIDENAQMLSERSFVLASGGLTLSFTVFTYIAKSNNSPIGIFPAFIWVVYVFCIIYDTYTIFSSKKLGEKLLKEFEEIAYDGNRDLSPQKVNERIDDINKKINRKNKIVYIILFANILLTLAYTLFSI